MPAITTAIQHCSRNSRQTERARIRNKRIRIRNIKPE
jgi:hypothetical protein